MAGLSGLKLLKLSVIATPRSKRRVAMVIMLPLVAVVELPCTMIRSVALTPLAMYMPWRGRAQPVLLHTAGQAQSTYMIVHCRQTMEGYRS